MKPIKYSSVVPISDSFVKTVESQGYIIVKRTEKSLEFREAGANALLKAKPKS